MFVQRLHESLWINCTVCCWERFIALCLILNISQIANPLVVLLGRNALKNLSDNGSGVAYNRYCRGNAFSDFGRVYINMYNLKIVAAFQSCYRSVAHSCAKQD